MYEPIPYPSVRYHRDGREQLIHTDEEHEALHAEGWRDTPAAFRDEPAVDIIPPSVQLEALQIAAKKKRK